MSEDVTWTPRMLDEAISEIGKQSAEDQALRSMLGTKLRKHAPDLVEHLIKSADAKVAALPFPPADQITALEVAIYDNLVPYGGVRPKRGGKGHTIERYKSAVKVWTCPVKEIDFQSRRGFQRFEVKLQNGTKIVEAAAKHEKSSRCDLADALRKLPLWSEFAGLGGALSSKPYGEGTVYHGSQIMMCSDDMSRASASIIDLALGSRCDVPPFSTKDASGRKLKGNVILQSRYSPHPHFINWRTGDKLY